MCFVCRDARECAPCEQSVGSWMAAILKTVVYLLLGFTDCQLRSSAAVMDSRLVRIFISVEWYSENVWKLGEELSHYVNLPKSPFLISFFLSFFLSFCLSFFYISCVFLAFAFLFALFPPSVLSCFLPLLLYLFYFFLSSSLPLFRTCFLFIRLFFLPLFLFFSSFFLSDLSENFCVSVPWFAAHYSVVAS
jgi:hypothetical protein